jgi:hypothetical protein
MDGALFDFRTLAAGQRHETETAFDGEELAAPRGVIPLTDLRD